MTRFQNKDTSATSTTSSVSLLEASTTFLSSFVFGTAILVTSLSLDTSWMRPAAIHTEVSAVPAAEPNKHLIDEGNILLVFSR